MSECTNDCASCGESCPDRTGEQIDFRAKANELSHIKKVVAIVSGKGGVGKSLVASMLAVLARRAAYRVALLDADVTGPSIPKAFGVTQRAEGYEAGLFPVRTKTGIEVMSLNLLLENDTDVYNADVVIDTVIKVVQEFFKHIKATPSEELLNASLQRNISIYQVALRQAEADFQQAQKEITALEEQTIKALTGENSIDVSIINAMMPKYREKRDAAQQRMKEAKDNMEREEATNRAAVTQVSDVIKWADQFDEANKETRHMILARLIDRVEVGAGYKIMVKFKITYEQFLGVAA